MSYERVNKMEMRDFYSPQGAHPQSNRSETKDGEKCYD